MTKRSDANENAAEKEALPVSAEELKDVQAADDGKAPRSNNYFIGTLNVFTGAAQSFIDPVKKVCYEPFQEHWEERYRKRYPKHAGKLLVLDLALLTIFGALLVGGIFAYFVMPLFPQSQTVAIQVLAPNQVMSGRTTDFIVAYRNETGLPLAAAELKVRLPEGFVPEDEAPAAPKATAGGITVAENPAAPSTRTFPLGDLKPFGQGEIRMAGTVYRPTGSKAMLSAELIYWREGESMPTRQAAYNEWLIEDSILDVGFRVADEIVRGQQSAITVTYANNGDEAIDAAIRLTTPDDFLLTGTEPRMNSRNEWLLNQLEPGTKGAITLNGILRSSGYSSSSPNFTVRGYVIRKNVRYLAQETRQSVATLSSGFDINQEITAPAGANSLKPGDEVTVTVRYHNGGDKALEDLRISLLPTTQFLLPLKAPDTWTWDATNFPTLARVESGGSGTLTAKLTIKPTIEATALDNAAYPLLEIKTSAEYLIAGDKTRPIHAEAETLSLPIGTSLDVKAAAFYFTKEGDQVGTGPLPPRVGETTKYRIFLQVTNTTTAVRDAKLEAVLPIGVEWTGKFSVTQGQPLARLPDGNRIVWDIGNVPSAASGATATAASFEVALTPEFAEIGIEPLLLKDIVVSGTDTGTDAKVGGSAENVTTELNQDPKAAGKGTVQAAAIEKRKK